jgi:hypothetical protein
MPDLPSPSRPALLRDALVRRFGKGGTALLAAMALLLISALAFTIEAEKPWGRTVQKRLQKQEALKPAEYAIMGLWWAALVNAGGLALLLATAGKWMPEPGSRFSVQGSESRIEQVEDGRPEATPREPATGNRAPGTEHHGWMLLLVLGAVAWGAWERAPRLSHSYWNDEAYSLNRYVRGAWEKQEDGRTVFEPVTWTDTLFENRNANNHLLNSLLARISLDLWQSATGAAPEAFRESVTRLPNFLAGLGTLFVMFLLGREIGSPLAGVAAAWLLALHPWHIRYAVEMRGYSLMLFFVALALFALVRALRTGRIRWWLLFAASEALFLLSFPGALYVAMAMNGLCVIELMVRKDRRKTGTLVAFNALAAIPVFQWMLPSIPQIMKWLHKDQPAYVTDVTLWLRDLTSVLAAGWQYENTYPDQQVGTDWQGIAAHFPIPPAAVAITLAVLFLGGLLVAMRRSPAARLIVIAAVIAALMSLAINLRHGSPMTVWYLIYLLLPATLAVPLALEWVGQLTKARWMPLALCLAFTVFYGMGTATAAAALRDHDRQPMRQTIAFIHAQGPKVMTATFGVSDRQHSAYDAEVTVLNSEADLKDCMARSRATAKPLYVYFCSDEQGLKRDAGIYGLVVKSGAFERVKDFPGSEELWSYRVYRLKKS